MPNQKELALKRLSLTGTCGISALNAIRSLWLYQKIIGFAKNAHGKTILSE
jgi:hypothetical protein